GDRENSHLVSEDIAVQPLPPAGSRVATDSDVDELDLPVGEPEQRIVLDNLAVDAGGGDAVAQERDRVAVTEGKVVGPCRRCQDDGRQQGECRRAHVRVLGRASWVTASIWGTTRAGDFPWTSTGRAGRIRGTRPRDPAMAPVQRRTVPRCQP